jgi:hypothetical protein
MTDKMDKIQRKKRGMTMILDTCPNLNWTLLDIIGQMRDLKATIPIADISEIIEDNPGIGRLSLIEVYSEY